MFFWLKFKILTLYHDSGCLWATKDPSAHSTEELPLIEWRPNASPWRPIWLKNANKLIFCMQGRQALTGKMFEDKPCKTTSARTGPFFPHWDHSTSQVQEFQHSMSQSVGQHSVPKSNMMKSNVKCKLLWTLLSTKFPCAESGKVRTNRETNSNAEKRNFVDASSQLYTLSKCQLWEV